jgi:hypothetical protein
MTPIHLRTHLDFSSCVTNRKINEVSSSPRSRSAVEVGSCECMTRLHGFGFISHKYTRMRRTNHGLLSLILQIDFQKMVDDKFDQLE